MPDIPGTFDRVGEGPFSKGNKSRKQNVVIACVVVALILALFYHLFGGVAESESVKSVDAPEVVLDVQEPASAGAVPMSSSELREKEALVRVQALTMERDVEKAGSVRTSKLLQMANESIVAIRAEKSAVELRAESLQRQLELEQATHSDTKLRLENANDIIDANLKKFADMGLSRIDLRIKNGALRLENEKLKLALAASSAPSRVSVEGGFAISRTSSRNSASRRSPCFPASC